MPGPSMKTLCRILVAALLATMHTTGAHAEDKRLTAQDAGGIYTFWPLFDYRSSPNTGYSNLSILGPIFKQEHNGSKSTTAIRPMYFNVTEPQAEETDLLYPVATVSSSEADTDTHILRLFRTKVDKAGTPEEKRDTMLFPFYISGTSKKYGPYTSVFPFYGDIYERFWRDEYHYAMFPIYGRTVKNGTTSTNWLYPIFNSTTGENESGFHVWPFYGQAAKAGVYEKSFVLWPFHIAEKTGLNTKNPTDRFLMLPFYASSSSPERSSTHAPWPFCGVVRDGKQQVVERHFFWPFWMTANYKDANTERYLPFYAESKIKDTSSRWVMWPIYRHRTIASETFTQDKTSLFYFLFNYAEESWPKLGKSRSKSTFWPLYAWKQDEDGFKTLSMPALLEPIVWNDGVERSWAPLWRLFISKRNEKGDGATSLLWNLYWSEQRGQDNAWELFPLASYSSTSKQTDFRLFKGLFGYSSNDKKNSLTFLWLPVARWGK